MIAVLCNTPNTLLSFSSLHLICTMTCFITKLPVIDAVQMIPNTSPWPSGCHYPDWQHCPAISTKVLATDFCSLRQCFSLGLIKKTNLRLTWHSQHLEWWVIWHLSPMSLDTQSQWAVEITTHGLMKSICALVVVCLFFFSYWKSELQYCSFLWDL